MFGRRGSASCRTSKRAVGSGPFSFWAQGPAYSTYLDACITIRNIFPKLLELSMDIKLLPVKTPDEFLATMNGRGWSSAMLAIRWGMTERRVRQIIADVARPRYYDDAVDNLPIVISR